ncbi:MAG: Hsp20/alpha crystallin family protein [Verrucomicrobiota bacterium]
MRTLALWDPFRDMEESFGRLANLFGRSPLARETGSRDSFTMSNWAPAVDIVEDKKNYSITAELPDVPKENVKVAVENGVLTISGERKYEHEEKDEKVHRIERSYGSFTRSFAVPEDADATKIEAEYKNGLLKVRLPKSEQTKPKPIEIKVA